MPKHRAQNAPCRPGNDVELEARQQHIAELIAWPLLTIGMTILGGILLGLVVSLW